MALPGGSAAARRGALILCAAAAAAPAAAAGPRPSPDPAPPTQSPPVPAGHGRGEARGRNGAHGIVCPATNLLPGLGLAGHIVGFSKDCPSVQLCCSEAQQLGGEPLHPLPPCLLLCSPAQKKLLRIPSRSLFFPKGSEEVAAQPPRSPTIPTRRTRRSTLPVASSARSSHRSAGTGTAPPASPLPPTSPPPP